MLSPVAIVPRRQKQGIGKALITRGLELLVERSIPVVFVEGPPQYYSYEPWMTGTLVYSEVFWRHDTVGLRE